MSEPGNLPRRRSFNRLSRGRDRDDDRSVGDRSGVTTASARRRRSRSPLRAVSKSSKSIVGKISKIGKKSKKDKSKAFEQAASALAYDDEAGSAAGGKAPSSAGSSGAPPPISEPDVAGGKTIKKSTSVPEMEDEETVYGVTIEKEPADYAKAATDFVKGSDAAPADAPASPAPEATKTAEEKVAAAAPVPEPAPVPVPSPAKTTEEPPASPKKETKKEAKKKEKEAKKEAKKKAEAAKKDAAKAAPQTKDSAPAAAASSSAPSTPTAVAAPGAAIQIILLLMDPTSRRFELLQLEFDSSRALVADVLAQIPLSATVESMRTQRYRGVCDRKGVEMNNDAKLVGFTNRKEGEVILAIPNGMKARECAKLARPILSDPNVVAMLNPATNAAMAATKEDTSSKKKDPSAEPEAKKAKSRDLPGLSEKTEKPSSDFGTFIKIFVAPVIVALGAYIIHVAATTPLGPGATLRPGARLSRCGLPGLIPNSFLDGVRSLAEKHVPDRAGLVPESCDPAEIEMGTDGVLRKYDGGLGLGLNLGPLQDAVGNILPQGEVAWEIPGAVCPEGDEACVPGLVVGEDGSLNIGGTIAKIPTVKDELEPWPFVIDPAKAGSRWW